MPSIARHRALALLSECTGETIWPVDHCEQRGVPRLWIDELAQPWESGFDNDRNTIYTGDLAYIERRPTNQFFGVRDVDLAVHLGKELGVDVAQLAPHALGRSALVTAIKQAVMEG